MVESTPLKHHFYKHVLLPFFNIAEVQKVITVIF